jgi:pyruvate formate lyase activating enzyme
MYFRRLCIDCGKCISLCPLRAISTGNDYFLDRNRCDACGICVKHCPAQALRMSGESYSSDQLFDLVMKDKNYFDLSGGGVTFSGGEPLLQPVFLKAILKKLKRYNIKTAIETAGYCQRDVFSEIAPYTDMFMFDIKHIGEKEYKDGTGVGVSRIIGNLAYLSRIHGDILVRIPLIPGYNMNKKTLDRIVMTIKKFNLQYVQLVPYHDYGLVKYDSLGEKYELNGLKKPSDNKLKELKEYLGKNISVGIMNA